MVSLDASGSRDYRAAMAYDEELAFRLRAQLETVDGITDKRMFGGLAFLLHGHLAIAASSKGGLMLHVDPAQADALLAEPHVSQMEMGGRTPRGWLRVAADGVESEDDLARWIQLALGYARSLPAKEPGRG